MIAWFILYPIYFITFFVSIFYFIIFFQTRHNYSSRLTTKFPFVSVVIPAYNEESSVENSIKSALNLDYPKDRLEVIFVNDGSTDRTYELAKKLEGENVKVFTKENGGKGSAMNFGIKRARGDFIVTLDSDTYMDSDLLKKAIPYFDDPKVGLLVPTLKPYKPKNVLERIQRAEYVLSSFNRKVLTNIQSMMAAPACTVFRAEVFDKIGFFDEDNLTEDFEISLRAQKYDYRLAHLVDAAVYTHVPKTIKSLYRQRLRWDYGTFYNLKKYKCLFSSKYGDFGVFYLPVFIIAIGVGILVYSLLSYDYMNRLFRKVHLLSLVNFNLHSFNFTAWSFVPGLRVIFGLFSLILALLLFHFSKEYTNEKKVSFISLIGYFTIFNFFMVLIWVVALFYFLFGKKPRW